MLRAPRDRSCLWLSDARSEEKCCSAIVLPESQNRVLCHESVEDAKAIEVRAV